ncbi:C1 family peptidase [Candidatus Electronema sp. PJ]|uniref:C1 family peptidase n=1 Tax=Candidatus Electronema sp. PJ TaxID=3401572 RepID=UPI003AA95BD6
MPAFNAVKPYRILLSPVVFSQENQPQVDLRPTIQSLNLTIRNQGVRGTCSVFAMTFLLEYMYGTRLAMPVADLSEEYLNYAANLVSGVNNDGDFFHNIDAGYQAWGIVSETAVPYQEGTAVSNIAQNILDSGKRWVRFKAVFIKPWDSSKGAAQSQLDQTLKFLDQNIPVAFGGWWFKEEKWRTSIIKGVEVMDVPPVSQKYDVLADGHSVALVGYRKDAAFPGGGYFVFRNSWNGWGDNGYGYMPFAYTLNYANDLIAYTTKDIVAKRIGKQAIVAQKEKLDIFVADQTGIIHEAVWQKNVFGGNWRGWWSILNGKTRAEPPSAVARDQNKLDVFVVGTDGGIYTAAWDRNVDSGNWRGWWRIRC